MSNEFRITLTTTDGNLIVNRKANKELLLGNDEFTKSFVDESLRRDCREKGVRLIDYQVTDEGITGIVDYL